MRKGIKILAKVISTIILLLIFLPVTIILVLNIEAVQNVIIKHASEYASEFLGTRVEIDRIDLDLFSRVRVEGFYVEDYEQDTMIYVKRATASISSLNIVQDGLRISTAEVEGAKLYLQELANGEINIRPIVRNLQIPTAKVTSDSLSTISRPATRSSVSSVSYTVTPSTALTTTICR